MIRLGIICPTVHLKDFAVQSDFHLVLPHILKQSQQYDEFYTHRAMCGDFILMDNSIFELDVPLESEELLQIADDRMFSEVVAPETLNNSFASSKQLYEFLKCRQLHHSEIGVLAMLQGESVKEMMYYYQELCKIDEVSTIGIPFRLENVKGLDKVHNTLLSMTLRRVFMRWKLLEYLNNFIPANALQAKPLHLMGLSDPLELQRYADPMLGGLNIRSNDSSSAYVHGCRGIVYTWKGLPGEKMVEKLNFEEDLHHEKFTGSIRIVRWLDAVNQNINMLKIFAGHDTNTQAG
jgi:hypothetical protein